MSNVASDDETNGEELYVVSDDEMVGEGQYAPILSSSSHDDIRRQALTMIMIENPAAQTIPCLPSDSVEAALVRALKARKQHTTTGAIQDAPARTVPTPSEVDHVDGGIRRFIAGEATQNADEDPYGLLTSQPTAFHAIVNDYLIQATKDDFWDKGQFLESPYVRDGMSYRAQVSDLQEQLEIWWAEEREDVNNMDAPKLIHVVDINDKRILWEGDFIPKLSRLDEELKRLDEQIGL